MSLYKAELPFDLLYSGKVRDTYQIGKEKLLMIATDRLSAYDVVFEDPIPKKGEVLTDLTYFWMKKTEHIIENHLISRADFLNEEYAKRSLVVKKSKPILIECIVRGYLAGSAYKEYKQTGMVCGNKLESGLEFASKLKEPIFTPSTKAEKGIHDENINGEKAKQLIGEKTFETVKQKSLELYKFAQRYSEKKGIILADTKFEFGFYNGKIILIDEILTPDSSRYWPIENYEVGKNPESLDKQYVRDYVSGLGWNKKPPAPRLPKQVIEETTRRYLDIRKRLIEG